MGESLAPYLPGAALLAVCAQQAEWQRLWTLTSDDPKDTTPADREWIPYSREV